ncbi:MAG: sarcosine oxidase subunit gamma SoxG [Desulfamplus sp.]|nr:sarcosine oxidase subunit gamma SoxG [Desulfamplus sp.]MBF0390876.1 sarcosine oxidase subunit gamma SoxG [Desulfamplus sp.]
MVEIKRYSPVAFKVSPKRVEVRDNWTVVLEYDGEGQGANYLVDLSHITRFDVQSSNLDAIKPFGVTIPQGLCESNLQDGLLINRMNGIQASIFCLSGKKPEMPSESSYTETTEVGMCMAIFGKNVFSITEKLTSLDFMDPAKKTPFLYQGPMSHIPCQIITLSRDGEKCGIIFTASRGYGKDMTHAIMDAGAEFGVKPAGEDKFKSWLGSL